MNATIQRLETDAFTEVEQSLSAWDQRYRQIGLGKFHGELVLTAMGSLGIFGGRWGSALHYQGVPPEGTVALAVTLFQPEDGRWMGQQMTASEVIIQPSASEGEFITAPFWDGAVLTIPESDLAQAMTDFGDVDPLAMLRRPHLVRLSAEASARVRKACIAYLRAARSHEAGTDAATRISEMATSTVELITRELVSARIPYESKPATHRQRHLVREVAQHCADRERDPIRIADLCREVGVSERTVRYAFQHVTGLSPLTFLKRERLNRVRDALRDRSPTGTLIKRIALSQGFQHLGQFSQDYRRLFGETPTETLRRRGATLEGDQLSMELGHPS
ncbi:MAG: hypothetical protein DRH23_17335 [Deltaproteobacteria bacterium]|nr:MAG: hypothetical protein DRH23_17335 [Deltaproteobacteria bacterium]